MAENQSQHADYEWDWTRRDSLGGPRLMRVERNRLAEAFIRGLEVGAEQPDLAGDGDAMYAAFRRWADGTHRDGSQEGRTDG